jgi:hypothetical protein
MDAAGEKAAHVERRDSWVASVLDERFRLGRGEVKRYRRLDDNYAVVRATLERGLEPGGRRFVRALPPRLTMYWYTRERAVEARRFLEATVARAEGVVDESARADEASARAALACILAFQGRGDLARRHSDRAVALLEDLPREQRLFVTDLLAMTTAAAMTTDEREYMRELADVVGWLESELADPDLTALHGAVQTLVQLTGDSDADHVFRAAEHAYQQAGAAGHVFAAFVAASAAAYAEALRGRPEAGLTWSDRAIDLSIEYGGRHRAGALETRGNLLARCGRPAEAATVLGAARAQARRLNARWPRRPFTTRTLHEIERALGTTAFDAAVRAGEHLTLADLRAPRFSADQTFTNVR